MDNLEEKINIYKEMIETLDECVDDYLFVQDIKNDTCFVSPHVVERFNLDTNSFKHPLEYLKRVIYKSDIDAFVADLNEVIAGKKDFHNMQYRWLNKDFEPIWINCRGKLIYDDHNQPSYLLGCVNEIGKKQLADNASGLLGEVSLKNLINENDKVYQQGFIMRLGIDDFKNINENYGVLFGDYLLKEIARLLRENIDQEQQIFKITGDEYILYDPRIDKDAIDVYHHIQEVIDHYIESLDYEIFFTFSAGLLQLKDYPTSDYNEIMKWSEFALNQAKEKGKNTFNVYNHEAYKKYQREIELTRKLRRSVIHGFEGFNVYYQPIVDSISGKTCALEALLRFKCEEFGVVTPVEFIPLLEKSDLIVPVGKWVLIKAIKDLEQLNKNNFHLKIHINLSYVQVLKSNVIKEILTVLDKFEIDNEQLVVELTESGFIESNSKFQEFCEELRKNKIQLALDDFGTGYSNFHYLYNLKPDYVKIDRGLLNSAMESDYEHMLLKSMIEMSHSVGVQICIEGVETKEVLSKTMAMKADYIQGYYYSKPCPIQNLVEKLNYINMSKVV